MLESNNGTPKSQTKLMRTPEKILNGPSCVPRSHSMIATPQKFLSEFSRVVRSCSTMANGSCDTRRPFVDIQNVTPSKLQCGTPSPFRFGEEFNRSLRRLQDSQSCSSTTQSFLKTMFSPRPTHPTQPTPLDPSTTKQADELLEVSRFSLLRSPLRSSSVKRIPRPHGFFPASPAQAKKRKIDLTNKSTEYPTTQFARHGPHTGIVGTRNPYERLHHLPPMNQMPNTFGKHVLSINDEGSPLVVNIIDCRTNENAKKIINEVHALLQVHHHNVVQLIKVEAFSNFAYFTLEYQIAETLMQTLARQTPSPIALRHLRSYGNQILRALDCLHNANIVHGDLMPQTVLICQNGCIKITNPGVAIVRGNLAKWPLETAMSYMAPEVYWCPIECWANTSSLTCAMDIWSFGSTMLACATGFNPFDLVQASDRNPACATSLCPAMVRRVVSKTMLLVPQGVASGQEDLAAFVDLCARCLQLAPEHRPTVSALRQHLFFTSA
mmetsp:Transcript_117995/g.205426  ORF Transcript_117995/g.205426 Transcript_117995/m.205426 type:complete len:495 (-) Transcript_117995:110-1594(-)